VKLNICKCNHSLATWRTTALAHTHCPGNWE